jgi:uncharacterized protein (DUF4415 family)
MKKNSAAKVTRLTLAEIKSAASRTDWPRLEAMSEKDITEAAAKDPEALPLDDPFFITARRLSLPALLKESKRQITLRLDAEVLDWFRATGAGYQSRMNQKLLYFINRSRGFFYRAFPWQYPVRRRFSSCWPYTFA